MDDKIFYAVMFYLVIFGGMIGFLPSSFFTGNSAEIVGNDIQNEFDIDDVTSTVEVGSLSYIRKVITFIFVPITINGIPTFISLVLQIINLFAIFGGGVWVYNKVRGI